jgi:hypothetical protein
MNRLLPMRVVRAAVSVLAVALAAGCGGSSDSPSAVRTEIGAAGGTVVGPDGVQVFVPAGALSQPVTIGIARDGGGAPGETPADHPRASAIYEFTPHGLVFQKPVTIRMPAPAGGAGPVFMAESAGAWEYQGAQVSDGTVSWQRNSFSWGAIFGLCAPANLPPWSAGNPDPYPCSHPQGYSTISAGTPGILTQLSPSNGSGGAGSWEVTQAGVLSFQISYRAAPDCENARAKLLRWDPKANTPPQVVFDGPVALVKTQVAPGSGFASGPAGFVGIGSHSVDVTFSHADTLLNAAGLHAFAYSFSCNRPGQQTRSGGDLLTVISAIPASSPATVQTYRIGGNASGVAAAGLVLQNNAADDLQVASAGAFTFAKALAAGAAYAVTVKTPPTGQTCTVSGGSGTVAGDVANVAVDCATTVPVGWGAPVAVSAVGASAAVPTLAAASDGGATVAWTQYDPAPESQYNVYGSRFVGGAWQPAQSIENLQANLASSLSGGAYTPVAAAAAGQSVVVYGFSAQQTVYHTGMSRATGTGWDSQVFDSGNNSNSGTVAMTGDGRAAVALYSQWNGAAYALRSQTVDLGSGTLVERQVTSTRGSDSVAVPMPGADVLAIWIVTGGTLQASRYTGATQAWATPVELSASPNTGSAYPPSLAGNAGGSGIASWLNLDRGYQVWASRYVGGTWNAPVQLAPLPGENQPESSRDTDLRSTAVGMDAAGNGYVAWTQDVTGSNTNAHVQVRRCAAAQSLAGCEAAVPLDNANEWAGLPSLAVAPNGDVWVAWVAITLPSRDLVLRVARRPAGGAWTAPVTVGTAVASTNTPPLAVDGQNRVSVAWLGSDQRVYVARTQ